MSGSTGDPERYSLEEMMERLKAKPSSTPDPADGELVTRADGTQAIKVRKRKRRSHQPQKEARTRARRSRILQVSALFGFVCLATLLAGAAILYSNSPAFRDNLVKMAATSTGANIDLKGFRMNPTHANATSLALAWPEGSPIQSLELNRIKARISPPSFAGRSFGGEELVAIQGLLSLQAPQNGKKAVHQPLPAGSSPVRFDRISVPKLEIYYPGGVGAPARILDTEGAFYPRGGNQTPQLLLNRGVLDLPGWQQLRLDRALIAFRGPEMEIVGMRLKNEGDEIGSFEITGTLRPADPSHESRLSLKAESFPLSGIAGQDIAQLIRGRFDTPAQQAEAQIRLSSAAIEDATLHIDLVGSMTSMVELRKLPFLNFFAQSFDDKWFSEPLFDDDCKVTVIRKNGATRLTKLRLADKNRLAVLGEITLDTEGKLGGRLEIGVTSPIIMACPNARLRNMFSLERDGYRWITLSPSGTPEAPADNMNRLFLESAPPPPGAGSGEDGGTEPAREVPSFEDLTRPR